MKDRATLLRALEAILFVADEPLAAAVLAQALPEVLGVRHRLDRVGGHRLHLLDHVGCGPWAVLARGGSLVHQTIPR